jgi:putative ABC transport system permease protein
VPESEEEVYMVDHRAVTPGYFEAIGARLEEGRLFDETDQADSEPVIVIDRALAERAYPAGDALGRTLSARRYVAGEFPTAVARVIGVVANVKDRSPSQLSRGQVFWPFDQSARWELTWAVRSSGDLEELISGVREQVRAVSPDLAVSGVVTMEQLARSATAGPRFVAILGSVFALLALLLAAFGLYGVVTYHSVQRAREFGLRRIVGARPGDILRDVLGDGVRLGVQGILLGVVGAVVLTRFLSTLLFEVSPTDPGTLAGAAGFVFLVQIAASLAPAVRAMRVDPLVAMRE